MKGSGAAQPLLFTMGYVLSEAVEQIATFSLPPLNKDRQCPSILLWLQEKCCVCEHIDVCVNI